MPSLRKPLPLVTVLTVVVLAASALLVPAVSGVIGASADRSRSWIEGGWRDWGAGKWRERDFYNPTIGGLWSGERMSSSTSPDAPLAEDAGQDGPSDPEPAPVTARAAAAPYRSTASVVGKVFFDSPAGPKVCSGTAVRDPARPGQSNLVWTAGHCVHAGADGGWFRNIVFVPSYNDDALTGAARRTARLDQVAPFGTWWAEKAAVPPQWTTQGTETGGAGASFDFAVLQVRPPSGSSSLEASLGNAVPVRFDVPTVRSLSAASAWGYPAQDPFDGELLYSCQDRPTRYVLERDQPALYRIGCTMTGGASGGGWFAQGPDGLTLVSNTSVGPVTGTWLAGPHLGAQAQRTFESISEQSGNASPSQDRTAQALRQPDRGKHPAPHPEALRHKAASLFWPAHKQELNDEAGQPPSG